MPIYHVEYNFTGRKVYIVEAASKEEAIKKAGQQEPDLYEEDNAELVGATLRDKP